MENTDYLKIEYKIEAIYGYSWLKYITGNINQAPVRF